ncbi:hypothetical protein JCM10207_002311 [Rhodosporidiobolus poonsookiae]
MLLKPLTLALALLAAIVPAMLAFPHKDALCPLAGRNLRNSVTATPSLASSPVLYASPVATGGIDAPSSPTDELDQNVPVDDEQLSADEAAAYDSEEDDDEDDDEDEEEEYDDDPRPVASEADIRAWHAAHRAVLRRLNVSIVPMPCTGPSEHPPIPPRPKRSRPQ